MSRRVTTDVAVFEDTLGEIADGTDDMAMNLGLAENRWVTRSGACAIVEAGMVFSCLWDLDRLSVQHVVLVLL